MISIDLQKIREDRTCPTVAYHFYGDAKEAGLRTGDSFQIQNGREIFEVEEYVRWRDDIQKRFAGFRCQQIND